MNEPPKKDRRVHPDRRKKPTTPFTLRKNGLSRKTIRRKADRQKSHYVDRYSLRSILAVFAVLSLSVLDAVLTLILVGKGKAKEANPLMDWMIRRGTGYFIAVKFCTALVGFMMLAVHRFFPIARPLAGVLLMAYGGIVCYHIYLLFQIHF